MSDQCESCRDRHAQIVYTEVREGQARRMMLCSHCATQLGIQIQFSEQGGLDIAKLLTKTLSDLPPDEERTSSLACPACSLIFSEFEASGRLGCPECYQTFMGDMTRILTAYHGACEHQGKAPRWIARRLHIRRRIRKTRENLQAAVDSELFEEAARLRDEVTDLEQEAERLGEENGS